jgi:hypothetical protein
MAVSKEMERAFAQRSGVQLVIRPSLWHEEMTSVVAILV